MSAPRGWICQVCRRVLDHYTGPEGMALDHTMQDKVNADHDAVPIPAPEGYREGRCDFCNADGPEFVLPARDFRLPGTGGDMSGGDWAACAVCALLIESDRWNELLKRNTPAAADEEVAAKIRALWRALRKNITGSIRPIS